MGLLDGLAYLAIKAVSSGNPKEYFTDDDGDISFDKAREDVRADYDKMQKTREEYRKKQSK